MPASIRDHLSGVMPACARSPQGGCGLRREQLFYSWFYDQTFNDTITISQGVRYARLHGCTRQHQHTLTLLSRPDALHTLPLTTVLGLCRVVRLWFSTTNLLGQLLPERAQRRASARAGSSRRERELLLSEEPARAEEMLGESVSVRTR